MIRLEQLRVDARLTPEQLGAACGVSGMTIRRIEAGKYTRVATLGKIADHFDGVQPSELTQPAVFPPPSNEAAA